MNTKECEYKEVRVKVKQSQYDIAFQMRNHYKLSVLFENY